MIRACIDCGRECWGKRCVRCHREHRRARSERLIPTPVNPIVVPPWDDCPELEFGFDVAGVCCG